MEARRRRCGRRCMPGRGRSRSGPDEAGRRLARGRDVRNGRRDSRRQPFSTVAGGRVGARKAEQEPVPARQGDAGCGQREDQARDLPAVRQHALQPRQPEHRVRPGADAAPAELPQGQRHAVHERPHDPDLAHGGRDPELAHGAVPGSAGADGVEQPTTTSLRRRSRHSRARSSTGRTWSTRRTTRCRTWSSDGQKTTPAPWVPFTRAGCDVGGVGTANIELENTNTTASGDMTKVFGMNSPEWNEANADSQAAQTDFVGIAIHCSQTRQSACNDNGNAQHRRAPGRARRLHGLPGPVRRQVRRSRRSPAASSACRTRTATRSPTRSAAAGSRGSTGCSRGTRSATSPRCRRRACPSPTATSLTRTTCTCRCSRATRTRARPPGRTRSPICSS